MVATHRSKSSCPGLSRASTTSRCSASKDVDGRVKPGHDGESTPSPHSIITRRPRKRALDHVADRLPGIAVELHQPHLLDRVEVGRAGVDRNARKYDRTLVIPERRRLPHDVLTRQVVAALSQ